MWITTNLLKVSGKQTSTDTTEPVTPSYWPVATDYTPKPVEKAPDPVADSTQQKRIDAEMAKYNQDKAKEAKLAEIAKTNTDMTNVWELWFQPLKTKLWQIWSWRSDTVLPKDFEKKGLWEQTKDVVKWGLSTWLKELDTVASVVTAWVDRAWNNTVDRITWDLEDKRTDVIKEDVKSKVSDQALFTKTSNEEAAASQAKIDSLLKWRQEVVDMETNQKAIEQQLATINPMDTQYIATKKMLESIKYNIYQKNLKLQQEATEYEKHRQEVLAVEKQREAVTSWHFETTEEAKHYNETVWKAVNFKDGRLYGVDWWKEEEISAIVYKYNDQIFKELQDIDEDNAKAGIITKTRNNQDFLNKLQYTLVWLRDTIDQNYDQLSTEVMLPSWEKQRVIDWAKVEDLMRSKYSQNLNMLSEYVSKSRVDASRNSLNKSISKDQSFLKDTRNTAVRSWDFLTTLQSEDMRTWWAWTEEDPNAWFFTEKWFHWFGSAAYTSWLSHATWQSTIAWDAVKRVLNNPAKTAALIASTIATMWETSLVAWAWEAATLVKWAAVVSEVWAEASNIFKITKLISKIPWFKNILTAAQETKWAITLANKINRFWIWLTESRWLNTAINFMARKWAGIVDEFIVSSPLDVMTSDEKDLWLNSMFNVLWWLWKLKRLEELKRYAIEISKAPTEIVRKQLRDQLIQLPEVPVKLSWSSKNVEKNIIDSITKHWYALLWNDKSKQATFMVNYLNAWIDDMTYENAKQISLITKAVEEDRTLWVTLAKNTSKDINAIIKSTENKASLAKTILEQNAIREEWLLAIKNRFKRMAASFDITRLNQLYNKKIAKEFVDKSFDGFVTTLSDNTIKDKNAISLLVWETIISWKPSNQMRKIITDRITEIRAASAKAQWLVPNMPAIHKDTIAKVDSVVTDDMMKSLWDTVKAWQEAPEKLWQAVVENTIEDNKKGMEDLKAKIREEKKIAKKWEAVPEAIIPPETPKEVAVEEIAPEIKPTAPVEVVNEAWTAEAKMKIDISTTDKHIEAINTTLSKLWKKQWWLAQEIINWLQKLIWTARENAVIFTKANLPENIKWMLRIISWETSQKMVLWLSWSVLEKITKFAKIKNPTAADMKTLSEWVWVFFHEIWHLTATSLDPNLKAWIIGDMKNYLIPKQWLDIEKTKSLVWEEIFNARSDHYKNLIDSKQQDLFLEEVFADKMQRDIHEAVFTPDLYEKKIAAAMDTSKTGISDIMWRINSVISQVWSYIRSLIKGWTRMWSWHASTEEMMTILNFSVIRGKTDLIRWWAKWKASKTFFKDTWAARNEAKVLLDNLTTEKETMLNMWAGIEAQNIAKAIKDKKEFTITADYLNPAWTDLLRDLMWTKKKEDRSTFVNTVQNSKKKLNEQTISSYFLLNKLYDSKAWVLNVRWNWAGLIWILKSLPTRLTRWLSNLWSRSWWVIMDSKLELIKYMMESNADKWWEIMKTFYNDYLKNYFTKANNPDVIKWFFKRTNPNWLENWMTRLDGLWDWLMNLYKDVKLKIRELDVWKWLSDADVEDIVNPILYNPIEYVGWVGRFPPSFTKANCVDSVVAAILNKRRNYASTLWLMKENDMRVWSEAFEAMSKWAAIRNEYILDMWESFWKFLDKNWSVIPLTKSAYWEWINKSLWYIIHNDNWFKWHSILENISDMMKRAIDTAGRPQELVNEISDAMHRVIYDEKWIINSLDAQRENLAKVKWILTKNDLLWNKEVSEIFWELEKSLSLVNKNRWSRILSDYLLNKIHQTETYKLLESWEKNIDDVIGQIEDRRNVVDVINSRVLNSKLQNFLDDFWAINDIKKDVVKFKWKERYVETVEMWQKQRMRLIEDYGFTEEEVQQLKELWWVDVNKILDNEWVLTDEEKINFMLDQMLSGKKSYNMMIDKSDTFRNMLRSSFDSAFQTIDKKENITYYTLDHAWSLSERFEWFKNAWIDRLIAKMVTWSKLMSWDQESQWILGRMIDNRKHWTIYSEMDLSKYMDWKVGNSHWIQSYLSAVKKKLRDITMWEWRFMKWTFIRWNRIPETTVWLVTDMVMEWKALTMKEPEVKELYDFLVQYKFDIDKYRAKYWLWDMRSKIWITWNKELVTNKIWNRMMWMRNFMSTSDIDRLWSKYWNWGMQWLLTNFLWEVVYWWRLDANKNRALNAMNIVNKISMRVEMTKMFWPQAFYKMWQQIFSNENQANWIIKAFFWSDTETLEDMKSLLTSRAWWDAFWFDIFKTEWAMWELWWQADLSSKWVWNTIANNANVLVLWDKAWQRQAMLASLAMALKDDYKWLGQDAIIDLHNKIKWFYSYMDKFWLKETDFIKWNFDDVMYKKMFELLETSGTKDTEYALLKLTEQKKDMLNFYTNTYSPLIWKVRANMWIFYVMDNIPELGSIRAIDNNRAMFWLMKRAMGKTWEYAYDVREALRWVNLNPASIMKALDKPIFTRMFTEITSAAKTWWLVDRLTDWEMNRRTTAAAIAVPYAAFSMLIWSTIYDNIIKYWIMWADKRWESVWEWIWNWTRQMLDDLLGRLFIYVWFVATDASKILATTEAWKDNNEKISLFRKSLQKQAWGNTLERYWTFSSAWYKTSAVWQLNLSTVISEYLFNTSSDRRNWIFNIWNNIYNFAADVKDDWKSTQDTRLSKVPIIWQFVTRTPDQWILMARMDEYIKDTRVDWFLKTGTPKWELLRLVDNFEVNAIKKSDKFDTSWMWWLWLTWDDFLNEGIIKWVIKDDLAAFTTITDWLEWKDATSKDMIAWWLKTVKPEEKKILADEFNKMYEEYLINKWKWDYRTDTMQQKFIAMASKFWWAMSMWGYMKAYMTWFKKMEAKSLWLKTKEITTAEWWDAMFLDSSVDWEWLSATTITWARYIEYVKAVRNEEKSLIANNWDWISWEKHIGINLMNKYIENDVENYPLWKYWTDIGSAKSNFSKIMWLKQLDEIWAQKWYPSLIGPIAYLQMKWLDFVNNLPKNATPDEVSKYSSRFIAIQEEMMNRNKLIEDPITREVSKAWIAGWVMKYLSTLQEKTPDVVEATIKWIWEEHLLWIIDRLTDSPPVAMASAFEQATWINIHWWTWGGRSWSRPAATPIKNWVDMIMANYNKLAWIAANSRPYSPDLPPKYKYERQPDWSVKPVGITVEPMKDKFEWEQVRYKWTESAKLDVTPLPVKEWRVLSWTYWPRAIKGAKVYSRKVSWKRL